VKTGDSPIVRAGEAVKLRVAPTRVASSITLSTIKVKGVRFLTARVTSEVVVYIAPFTVLEGHVSFIVFPLPLMELVAGGVSFVHELSGDLDFGPIVNFEFSHEPDEATASNDQRVWSDWDLVVESCSDDSAG
jgi:hypothetical protein